MLTRIIINLTTDNSQLKEKECGDKQEEGQRTSGMRVRNRITRGAEEDRALNAFTRSGRKCYTQCYPEVQSVKLCHTQCHTVLLKGSKC